MLHYMIQTIAFQLFFLLVYDLFLKKETFFNWNRMYLLSTAVLSLILPFIKVDSFKEVVSQDYIISLPEIILGQSSPNTNNAIVLDAVILENNSLSFWEIIFYTGVFVAFCLFLIKVIKILVLVIKNPKQSIGNVVLVELINSNAAFSFFHYIFLGEYIKTEDKETILKHELIHTEQRHTLDLLFFEVLRIVFWFNPFVYMYQNRLATLHEFIADANALKHQDKEQYYQNLLAQVFETKNISFINTFFNQSLIKKRIVMLSKSKSKQINLFKYVLLIPLVLGMMVYTSSEAQEKSNQTSQSISELQGLSDEQLKEKFSNEYKQMKANGVDLMTIAKAFVDKTRDYIFTKEDYYRNVIFSYERMKEYKPESSKFKNESNKTYAEYLEWKKTDEAKEVWENDTYDGVLKLVVNDLNNLTLKEKKKFNKKKELLSKDVFFAMLKMTDVKGSGLKMFYQPNEFSTANKRDESKALLLNETIIEVGYDVIDQAPVFPGCEGLTNSEIKNCTTSSITKHIVKNFSTSFANELGLKGRQRINVIFKIDTEGSITGIRSRASHSDLEKEAIRVIKTLPRMIPGKHKGKNVEVPYSLPIIFQIQDDSLLDETVINNDKVVEVKSSEWENIEVPFSVIENVPVFPGCEALKTNAEKKNCMSNKIYEFVTRKFNTNLATDLGLTGIQRINVIFKINMEGVITTDEVRARAPHIDLEAEAIRVISLLPKMKPGVQSGKAVTVPYSLPIIFDVEEKTEMLEEVIIEKKSNQIFDVPFSVVDAAPIFSGCESLQNRKEQMECTSNSIARFVNKNFNTKLATELGLIGRQRINVIFKIDKQGDIIDIRSRAPHPSLEAEAIRVINTLPKMMPGKQRGELVNVPYSLPIIFQVSD